MATRRSPTRGVYPRPARAQERGFGRILQLMRAGGIVLGLLAATAGFIWIAQGLNLSFAPHSFMTSDRAWVLYGAVALGGGLAIARWSWRRS